MSRLDGKVVLITGAGDGIGRVMAEKASRSGARVVLAGRRIEPLEETGARLAGEWIALSTDVTIETQVEELVRRAIERFGQVDVLLNNAAQPGKDLHIWEQTLDNWNATIATNVTGPMLCAREVMRQSMAKRKTGSIVNFSSYVSWQGKARKSHYCVSKSGVRSLTKVLAIEGGPYGIRAHCVVPGATSTDLLTRYMNRIAGERGVEPEVIAEDYRAASALRQINTPEQVADAALFLASDLGSGITGQSIPVDAGAFFAG